MKLIELARLTEDEARDYLEGLRWPNGPVCPRCWNCDNIYRLQGKSHRKGLLKCGACREPFSVTVGTVMESSRVPLTKWLVAFHLMTSSKKGFSAHQLHRTIGVTYKTAWFMAHRIRYAMRQSDFTPLSGVVEVDETYVGGKPRKTRGPVNKRADRRYTDKTPVFALVERNGRAIAMPLERVRGAEMKKMMRDMIQPEAKIMTDESTLYRGTEKHFASHETVNHTRKEYARGDVTTNSVESFFALVKRQHYGTNHQYSKKHMPAYITETEFRWNARKLTDEDRREQAIRGIEGKRLTYRRPD
jgi:transposase-like protein